jgi:hypothetical protein
MPFGLQAILQDKAIQLAIVVIFAVALVAAIIIFRFRRRQSPEERERLRRQAIQKTGRIGTGVVSEFQGNTVYFVYSIGGIEYSATQDISTFRDRLSTENDHLLIGPCTLKYLNENPANSIVICEEWNGLRPLRPHQRDSNQG